MSYNILITGVAGNIGSNLALNLLNRYGYNVVGIDNLSTGKESNIPLESEKFSFYKIDVNDFSEISSIFYFTKFDYVFHFAAVVGVNRTLENPILVLKDIDGIKNILSLSKNSKVKRVFYSSSSEVYGEPVELPQLEDTTPLNSRLPYAIVKNLGEAYFKSYKYEYDLDYTIFRFFNTYGPNQSEDFVMSKFIRAAKNNVPLTIYGDGLQTRTFCYIDDNTDTMVNCLENPLYVNDLLNIGSDIEITILDLAKLIIKITNSKSDILFLPPLKEGDMTRRLPDISKMKKALLRDTTNIEEGIKRVLEYCK